MNQDQPTDLTLLFDKIHTIEELPEFYHRLEVTDETE
tara:strand:- start:28 stop:138 length:111 start_codon:yes stop_codon:yes gene_type:complete